MKELKLAISDYGKARSLRFVALFYGKHFAVTPQIMSGLFSENRMEFGPAYRVTSIASGLCIPKRFNTAREALSFIHEIEKNDFFVDRLNALKFGEIQIGIFGDKRDEINQFLDAAYTQATGLHAA